MTSPDFMNVLFAARHQARQNRNADIQAEQITIEPKMKVKRSYTLLSNILSFVKRIKNRHAIQS